MLQRVTVYAYLAHRNGDRTAALAYLTVMFDTSSVTTVTLVGSHGSFHCRMQCKYVKYKADKGAHNVRVGLIDKKCVHDL